MRSSSPNHSEFKELQSLDHKTSQAANIRSFKDESHAAFTTSPLNDLKMAAQERNAGKKK